MQAIIRVLTQSQIAHDETVKLCFPCHPYKSLFAVPLPVHLKPPYQKSFWHFWRRKHFLPHFHKKIIIFSLSSNERGCGEVILLSYPTKIFGVGIQQTNNLFKDGLNIYFSHSRTILSWLKIKTIRTPSKMVIILKIEQCCFNICVKKM